MLNLSFGTDGKFSEVDIILRDIEFSLPGTPVFKTLEATCNEALRLAYRKKN